MRERTELELQVQPLNMEYSLKNGSIPCNIDSMTTESSENTLSCDGKRRSPVWSTSLLLRIIITYIFATVVSTTLLVPLAIVYLRHNTFFDYPFFALIVVTTSSVVGLIISVYSFRQLLTGTSKYTPFHLYFSILPVLSLVFSLVFYGVYKAGYDPFSLEEIFQLQLLVTDRFKKMLESSMLRFALRFGGIKTLDFETILNLILRPEVLELADNIWTAAQIIFVFSTVISLVVFTWSMVETIQIRRLERRDQFKYVQTGIFVKKEEKTLETSML